MDLIAAQGRGEGWREEKSDAAAISGEATALQVQVLTRRPDFRCPRYLSFRRSFECLGLPHHAFAPRFFASIVVHHPMGVLPFSISTVKTHAPRITRRTNQPPPMPWRRNRLKPNELQVGAF